MKQKIVFYFFLILCFCLKQIVVSAQVSQLKFSHITSENGLPQNSVYGIVKDKYGFMWFGTWGGLCRYDGYSFKTYYYNAEDEKSINSNRISNILKDNNGDIWILTFERDALCKYNYFTDNFDRILRKDIKPEFLKLIDRRTHYQTISYVNKNLKWSLNYQTSKLIQTNLHSKENYIYQVNPYNIWSLNNDDIADLYKDNHQILWVATTNNGLNKANINAKPFKYYYHNPKNQNSITDNNIRAITQDKEGNLWIGTKDKGLSVLTKNTTKHIYNTTSNVYVKDNQIRSIFCDSRGIVWIGSKNGLSYYNSKTQKFKVFNDKAVNHSVFGIAEDAENNIWLATWNGIVKYKVLEDKLISYNPETTLKRRYARVVMFDKKQQLWVGTEGGGVSIFKTLGDDIKIIKHLQRGSTNTAAITEDRINTLFEDIHGNMWIGTGNGLNCYNTKTGQISQFAEKNGLANAIITAITDDQKGNLWISHKKGLSKFNLSNHQINNYNSQDGLQNNEFNENAIYKNDKTKELFFGGINGYNVFNPDSIFSDKTLPQTALVNLEILNQNVKIGKKVNGRIVLEKPLHLTDKIELNSGDKSFAIEFSALHYANPLANKYAYMLEGFDKNWIYTDANRRIATYSNLSSGSYTFKVKSSNSDGVWNDNPATLKIKVAPPIWATKWAYLFYVFIILLAFWIYHTYKVNIDRLKSKLIFEQYVREKEQELHADKVEFFTNISHEIKTPLTLIKAPVDRLLSLLEGNKIVNNQLITIKSSVDRLLKLVNQLLDFEKLENGKEQLKLNNNDILILLKSVLNSFTDLAEEKSVKLELVSKEKQILFLFDYDKIEKVFNNIISNAVKFANINGLIKVVVLKNNNQIFIDVFNTGKVILPSDKEKIFEIFRQGKDNELQGTGIGLSFSKKLIELHGGNIFVESTAIENTTIAETTFKITLPMREAETINLSNKIDDKVTLDFVIDNDLEYLLQKINNPLEKITINDRQPVILIVEDNIELRNYLSGFFKESFRVLEASNGKDGFDLALKEQPDLVISDVMMPEVDGISFCAQLKLDFATGHIPIILLTAKSMSEDEILGLETGADDYITKPFNLEILLVKVKNILKSRQGLKEKYRKEVNITSNVEVTQSPDEKMLVKLLAYVETRISDSNLNIEDICENIGISRTQLYRKLKALTGLSMAEIIKEMRFKKAKQLLKENKFNVNEIAYMAGFSDPDYFRKCFKTEVGLTPSEFAKLEKVES